MSINFCCSAMGTMRISSSKVCPASPAPRPPGSRLRSPPIRREISTILKSYWNQPNSNELLLLKSWSKQWHQPKQWTICLFGQSLKKNIRYNLHQVYDSLPYCWWKKSCTTWDVQNLVNNGINYLSTGAGFLPSTVWVILMNENPGSWKSKA